MITYLDLRDIMILHRILIEKYGGLDGVRDQGLLESALAQPQQSAFGEDVFSDIPSKAASYAYYLSENQPFIDGNKRIATAAALTFLRVNGYETMVSPDDLYETIMKLANHKMNREQLVGWFQKNSKGK